MNDSKGLRIALVGSSGGHLSHLLALETWWGNHDRFWVTFDKPDSRGSLAQERVYWCYFPTNRSVKNLLRNTALAWTILRRERPDVIVSAGAAVAVPFFWLGKLFGARTLYLEVYDRIDVATITGRLVRPVTDRFLVQWPEQGLLYRNVEVVGELL